MSQRNVLRVGLPINTLGIVAAALFATGCVPIPSQTTTMVYEAQGANAKTSTGGGCTGVAYSYYQYNLDGIDLPVPSWRTKPEDVRVQVLPRDLMLEVSFSGFSSKNRKSVEFDASKIQIMIDGELRSPKATSVDRYADYLWGTSLKLEIDIGAAFPETVVLETRPKAILVNHVNFSLPKMTFKRATRTTTMLVQPINC